MMDTGSRTSHSALDHIPRGIPVLPRSILAVVEAAQGRAEAVRPVGQRQWAAAELVPEQLTGPPAKMRSRQTSESISSNISLLCFIHMKWGADGSGFVAHPWFHRHTSNEACGTRGRAE